MQILAPRTGNCGHQQANWVAEPHGAAKGAGPRRGKAGSELELSSPAARPVFHKSGYAKLPERKICLKNNAGDCWIQLPPVRPGNKRLCYAGSPGTDKGRRGVYSAPRPAAGLLGGSEAWNCLVRPLWQLRLCPWPRCHCWGGSKSGGTRVAERRRCSQCISVAVPG